MPVTISPRSYTCVLHPVTRRPVSIGRQPTETTERKAALGWIQTETEEEMQQILSHPPTPRSSRCS